MNQSSFSSENEGGPSPLRVTYCIGSDLCVSSHLIFRKTVVIPILLVKELRLRFYNLPQDTEMGYPIRLYGDGGFHDALVVHNNNRDSSNNPLY